MTRHSRHRWLRLLLGDYVGTLASFRSYCLAYGGWRAVLLSPYLRVALALAILTTGTWTEPNWWDTPLSVLPNLVGFTLGGYAILIAFGDERFKVLLTRPVPEKPASTFMAINATFVHFLVVQVTALLLAIFAKSRPLSFVLSLMPGDPYAALVQTWPAVTFARRCMVTGAWFVGYVMFLYAIVSALAATAAIFWVGGWFEKAKHREAERDGTQQATYSPKPTSDGASNGHDPNGVIARRGAPSTDY
jgi:hypothetical protein